MLGLGTQSLIRVAGHIAAHKHYRCAFPLHLLLWSCNKHAGNFFVSQLVLTPILRHNEHRAVFHCRIAQHCANRHISTNLPVK
jgi:hypothetical protein